MTDEGNRIGVYLPESLAREGFEFIFVGSSEACDKCPLYKQCVGRLENDRRYRVIEVIDSGDSIGSLRPTSFRCKLTNEPVKSVILTKSEFVINLSASKAVPNVSLIFDEEGCTNFLCPERPYCNYSGIPRGVKITIEDVFDEEIECPHGTKLKKVKIKIVDVR